MGQTHDSDALSAEESPAPALSEAAVRKVAKLARLDVTDEQASRYARELTSVLGYIDRMREMDLADVEPMAHVLDATNRLDPDEPGETLSVETLMTMAPDVSPPFLNVPKVLNNGDSA